MTIEVISRAKSHVKNCVVVQLLLGWVLDEVLTKFEMKTTSVYGFVCVQYHNGCCRLQKYLVDCILLQKKLVNK